MRGILQKCSNFTLEWDELSYHQTQFHSLVQVMTKDVSPVIPHTQFCLD